MPIIEAKRAGPCAACLTSIVVGERIEYSALLGPRHLACSDKEPALRRNAYAMDCSVCRAKLKKGTGTLTVTDEQQSDGTYRKRYRAQCVDVAGCQERCTGEAVLAYTRRRALR